MGTLRRRMPEDASAATVTSFTVSNAFDDIQDIKEWEEKTGLTKDKVMQAIPDHCKVRSALWSFVSLFRDLVYVAAWAGICYYLTPYVSGSTTLEIAFWSLYALVMGTITTGIWVIGHECGHGAFSESKFLNDLVGFITHTALLVPYHSWQFTHAKHHKYTNHMTQGETHVPPTKATWMHKMQESVGDVAQPVLDIFLHLLFGWPLYLALNLTGGRVNWKGERLNKKGSISHFVWTKSQIFPPQWHNRIAISALGFFGMLGLLGLWAHQAGSFLPVVQWYVGPLLVTNGWLVLYTWLHHTHEDVPHLGENSFNWLRGAMSTIDRPYPALINHVHHEIGSTHVLHHLNSRIPHYHAVEATRHLQEVLGGLYRYDSRGIWEALWSTSENCQFVDGVEGVQWFKKYQKKSRRNKSTKDEKVQESVNIPSEAVIGS